VPDGTGIVLRRRSEELHGEREVIGEFSIFANELLPAYPMSKPSLSGR
jgi:hypothetical protein